MSIGRQTRSDRTVPLKMAENFPGLLFPIKEKNVEENIRDLGETDILGELSVIVERGKTYVTPPFPLFLSVHAVPSKKRKEITSESSPRGKLCILLKATICLLG